MTPEVQEADEDQVVRWVGARLMAAAPEGWLRIDLTVSAADEITAMVVTADGSARDIAPLPDIGQLLFALRHKMHEPEHGTWLSLRMHIEPTGSYYIHYQFTPVQSESADGNALLLDVADHLKFALPVGWTYLQLQYRAVDGHEEAAAIVGSLAGGVRPWTPPARVNELLSHHRATTARADVGPWQSLRYEMRFPESVNVRFNGH